MSRDSDLYSLPETPDNLCFDKTEFSKKTFSADHFLQNHRKKANLENLRDDLGVYLKVLRSAMIDLINKDYADFVNLSTNLIGLDKAISNIQVPLGQLREEVLQVKLAMEETKEEVSQLLDQQQQLQLNKRSLQSLACVQSLLGELVELLRPNSDKDFLSVMERAALQFNELQFHMTRCHHFLNPNHLQQGELISSRLMLSLNAMFLDSLKQCDAANISRCLRIYLSLDQTKAAEELFRKEVVSPTMQDIISEVSLQSDPNGLRGLYSRILAFVTCNMKELLQLTKQSDRSVAAQGFDFLTNSFWVEVEQRLERDLTSIVAFGIPEVFHQNYCETADFLEKLESHFRTKEELMMFRKNAQYKAFLDHWNLTVYFPIRSKEIVKCMETALSEGRRLAQGSQFHLLSTTVTWECLERCWSQEVFLPLLAHRFWKLSLMIISRYCIWIGEVLEQKHSSGMNADNGGIVTDHVQFLVYLHADVKLFADKLPQFVTLAFSKLTAISCNTQEKLRESVEESKCQLTARCPIITQFILGEVSADSLAQLRQVSDIPRLFRRTNRDVPSKPCSYVAAVLAPPQAFYTAQHKSVGADVLHEWLTLIFSAITSQYYSSVDDVLTSVQKTEESLRRLKKARDRTSVLSSNEGKGLGDDDKIRLQLVLDVQSYCKGVESVGLKREEVPKLVELLELVTAAQMRSDSSKS